MLRHGFKTLDELEAQEEKEKQEKEAKEKGELAAMQPATDPNVPAFSPEEMLVFEYSSFWELLTASGRMPPASQGS